MKIAKDIGADYVEIHTGKYSDAINEIERKEELKNIEDATRAAKALGLKVNAGHGLDYKNVAAVAKIKDIVELNMIEILQLVINMINQELSVKNFHCSELQL